MKKLSFTIALMVLVIASHAQEVNAKKVIPQNKSTSLDHVSFSNGTNDFGGLVLNYMNGTIFGKSNSLSLFTSGNRDLTFYSGTGNIVFFPNASGTNTALRQSGNIGIGTTSPQNKLHLNLGEFDGINLDSKFMLRTSASDNNHFVLEHTANNGDLLIRSVIGGASDTGNITMNDLGGNVGIGSRTPLNKLHVLDSRDNVALFESSAFSSQIKLKNTATGGGTWSFVTHSNNTSISRNDDANDGAMSIYDADNNVHRFVIRKDGNVGIGTSKPTAKLQVNGGLKIGNANPYNPDPAYYENDNYISFRHGGTSEDFIGYKNNTFYLADSPGGGDTKQPDLVVKGKIVTTEVKVNINAMPDYVFADDYDLRTLKEVEDFIAENKHLPGVPSEAEVTENGIGLSLLSSKLLEKVEELTLYTIDQDKKLKKLQEENKKLTDMNRQLLELQLRLEKLESDN